MPTSYKIEIDSSAVKAGLKMLNFFIFGVLHKKWTIKNNERGAFSVDLI